MESTGDEHGLTGCGRHMFPSECCPTMNGADDQLALAIGFGTLLFVGTLVYLAALLGRVSRTVRDHDAEQLRIYRKLEPLSPSLTGFSPAASSFAPPKERAA